MAAAVFTLDYVPVSVLAYTRPAVRVCEGDDACVCDVCALDKADPLEFRKGGQPGHRVVRQVSAAAKIDIAEPVARRYEALDCIVCNVSAVAEVKIVQILAESREGIDGSIRQVTALLQHNVPKPWRNVHNLFHGTVCESRARAEVQNAQMLIRPVMRK